MKLEGNAEAEIEVFPFPLFIVLFFPILLYFLFFPRTISCDFPWEMYEALNAYKYYSSGRKMRMLRVRHRVHS